MIKAGTWDVDFTILGAGIAGLSMADALLIRGKTVAIVDTAAPGDGSSGAPLVLINPATGRRAKMVLHAEKCIAFANDLLKRTADDSGESFYSKNGVLRPALTKDLANNFKRSPKKYDWPDSSWIHWLDEDEFKASYLFFGIHFGGLKIPNAYTVEANTFIHLLTSMLHNKGLQTYFDADYNVKKTENSTFKIQLESNRTFTTNAIIYAVGSGIRYLSEWQFLPASFIKGQLLDINFKDPLPFEHSISSMGYFAFNPEQPNRLVAGSTYEHHYNHMQADEKGKKYLYDKLERTFPGLKNQEHSVSMWAGERVSLNDHNPVAGRHPELENRFIIGGLGSKGMIYGRYLAEQLTNYILDGKPINSEFSVERFLDS